MSFAAHVSLLSRFLAERRTIAERIEQSLLNVRGKDISRSRDRNQFSRLLEGCFFGLPGLPRELVALKGELAARHLADGFELVQLDGFANELDPLELIVRGYEYWEATRWPGSAGRLTFARTIFAVFLIRHLEYLSLRIWDEGKDQAEARLNDVQILLDRLNEPEARGPYVRDARWLIHTGLGPFTRHLQPYFDVADHIAGSFTDAARVGLHSAGARLAGGHLRSQLHYRMWQTHLPIADPENLAYTRNSNALDNALLVRDLVPLVRAYQKACEASDDQARFALADAILQGLSVDPDLFVARLDLLGPYAVIEDLFFESDENGQPRPSTLGRSQASRLGEYAALIGEVAPALRQDADRLDPAHCGYSPLGATYGFCADLMSNMAMDSLSGPWSDRLSLEDVFTSGGNADDKLALAQRWQRLPRRPGEQEHFDYSKEFAEQLFRWLTTTLEARAGRPHDANVSPRRTARVYVTASATSDNTLEEGARPGVAPADDYRLDTDPVRAASTGATSWPRQQLLTDRHEGRLLASQKMDDSWIGLSKILLTRLIDQGTDAVIHNVSGDLGHVLKLACPALVVELPRTAK